MFGGLEWFYVVFLICHFIHMYCRWHYRDFLYHAEKLPGPFAIILFGNIIGNILRHERGEIVNLIQEVCEEYGTPSRCWVGPALFVFIDKPEHVQIVLTSPHCLAKPHFYTFLRWDKALFPAIDAEQWKEHRKLLNPSFKFNHVLNFIPIFNSKSLILLHELEKRIGEENLDIFEPISLCTLEIIIATALGLDLKIQETRNLEHIHALERILHLSNYRVFHFYHYLNLIYERTNHYKEEMKARDIFQRIINIAIEKKQQEFTQNNNKSDSSKEETKPPTLIDRLFELSKTTPVIDEQTINDQLKGIIFAGNETTAMTIASAILMMAIHQDVQDHCVQEIHDTVGDGLIDYEAISKLNYLEMVLRETGRLFTVGPIVGRYTTGDIQLGETTIPAGTNLLLNVHRLHRRVDIWGDDADAFNPDRFLPEEVEKRHPYAYIPFSGGLRNCIGLRYAGLSMKTILCHLLRKFKFTTHLRMQDIKTEVNVTLKLLNRHLVKVERRDFNKFA